MVIICTSNCKLLLSDGNHLTVSIIMTKTTSLLKPFNIDASSRETRHRKYMSHEGTSRISSMHAFTSLFTEPMSSESSKKSNEINALWSTRPAELKTPLINSFYIES